MARRFGRPWGKPVFHGKRLEDPAKVKEPGRVFVCSMSDFFHPDVEAAWQTKIFEAINRAPWHTYLFLTKRADRMAAFFALEDIMPNWWIGVTAENQARFDERWKILRDIDAMVRFVSVEPMLGPVALNFPGIVPDWIIVGPENGPGARPCDPEWINDLQDECRECLRGEVAFFDKRSNWTRREFPTP